ncbi:M20/M25/M40 family metallo-hydrolase [Leekyejoonella antrihumi]|uniref:M20/M25/M40 family metallo-hydrolase n=1 Tax=Leekyejoonella antrihumi TaxID=1660198 RepID=A0A563E079_9MICO|nr:M20/M25/M40 family metallo-hydrolase [Leekyejoonella antrihumi]TWP35779.1 M20/M25/M40 family metallo-hydrolase [Leekyejoonella antrihumi]
MSLRATASAPEYWSEDAVALCSDLIRLDGQLGSSDERAGAEYVATLLDGLGIESELVESAPRRSSLVARVAGANPELDPLLIHMHLDVVPADASEWSVHPLSGEVTDDFVWGRGAVDMKNMAASVLTVLKHRVSTGRLPRRPLVLAFLADEENAGVLGAEWLVRERPDLFEGCRTAIGEGGGWSLWTSPEQRIYPVHNAEKGWAAIQVTAHGAPGHASRINDQNPIRVLAEAIGRLTSDRFPVHLTEGVESLLRVACDVHGLSFDPERPEEALPLLGFDATQIRSGLQHTAHPTRTSAGYQSNVVPSVATAELDCRYLPGRWEEFEAELHAALGDQVEVEVLARTLGLTPGRRNAENGVWSAASTALQAEDPTALVAPFMTSGGTDATHLERLGIECFGFSPVLLPPDLDFWALFHGVDERIPSQSLRFASRVLDRFLDSY